MMDEGKVMSLQVLGVLNSYLNPEIMAFVLTHIFIKFMNSP